MRWQLSGVNQQLRDWWLPPLSLVIPDFGHLEGVVFPMVTCKRKKFDHEYIFLCFLQSKKVFMGNNSISMATPEGFTNAWNSHCSPIKLNTFNSLINRATQNGEKTSLTSSQRERQTPYLHNQTLLAYIGIYLNDNHVRISFWHRCPFLRVEF